MRSNVIHRTVVLFLVFVFVFLNSIELTPLCCERIPVSAVLRRLGLRPTESSSIRPETATVDVAEKACGAREGTVDIQYVV